MKIARLRTAVAMFSVLASVSAVQAAGIQQVSPNEVSVSPCESPRLLFPDDDYCIQIEFNRAPEGYDGGTIYATFKQTSGPPPTNRFADVDVYATENTFSKTDLINHQATYKLKVHIIEPMAPGTWELKEITLGNAVPKQIPISGTASFEVGEPSPIMFHVHAPASVTAGETYNVTVILDKYPAHLYRGCELELEITLKPASPGSYVFEFDPQEITPDEHSYTFSHRIPSDFPKSSLQGEVGTQASRGCRFPEVQGDLHFKFEVEPNTEVVTPTSVKVIVNPSQVQLLRGEIDRLNAKAQNIKEELGLKSPADRQALLLGGLNDASTELAATEKAYKERGKEPSYIPAINIFFGDIERTYRNARKALADSSAKARTMPGLRNVSLNDASPGESGASDVVFAAIRHNVAAYEIATASKVITFNLDVYSHPSDAEISYRIEGDDDYTPVEHHTDWRIENLPLATYEIRLQLSGYEDYVAFFNAVKNTGSSVNARLIPKKRPGAP